MIAVGSYTVQGNIKPLILYSQDQGQSWSYVKSINNVSMENLGKPLNKISCNKKICIAASTYGDYHGSPLLISFDRGQSWLKQKDFLANPAITTDVTCTQDKCLASGTFMSSNMQMSPFILESNLSGTTWYKSNPITDLFNDEPFTIFRNISCSNSHCVITGTIAVEAEQQMLLHCVRKGHNNLQEWKLVKPIKRLATHISIDLTALACASDVCLAGGVLQDPHVSILPLIQSRDGGKHWELAQVHAMPRYDKLYLHHIGCNKSQCITVGEYHTDNQSLPLIIHGEGNQLTAVQAINTLPADFKNGRLIKISCSQMICVAIGTYQNRDNSIESLLLTSKNNGKAWQFVPAMDDGIQYTNVHCKDKRCIIGGDFSAPKKRPALVITHDAGETWQLIHQFNSTPENIDSAIVYALTID